ncbi:MAG: EVE domain-containing protein [Planctomycetes bacterium]|nr:EVE domain-containing protein [Planctomycetota bacterium]MCW8134030.1 EVE domain-containing protein [Planctomycetota bacterium]
MAYWLVKSEPCAYSIDDLARDRKTSWEGIRNYQARNNLRAMAPGDLVLFYHSSAKPTGVVGVAKVAKAAYPDPAAFDPNHEYFDPKSKRDNPTWFLVDLAFVEKLPRVVTIEEIKAHPKLKSMVLVKSGRLSVQPVTADEFKLITRLAGKG